jgi:hypothetical protein
MRSENRRMLHILRDLGVSLHPSPDPGVTEARILTGSPSPRAFCR